MNTVDIAKLRLASHGLAGNTFTSPAECVSYLGAMQAQDLSMAKWALGTRVKNSSETQVNQALDEGEIIRTHVLRPTWHLVSPKNIYWMLALTAPRIRATMNSSDKQLGLTEKIFDKSNAVIEKAFEKKEDLTRDELIGALNKAGIATNDNRASHLFVHAELCGLLCSGRSKGLKSTFALLEKRVKKTKSLSKEEALAKLATLYFKSHGPASVHDFIWWSGLSPVDSKIALESVRKELQELKTGEQILFMAASVSAPPTKKATFHLLPGFDELVISYKDRSAAITAGHHKRAISSNGIFNPTIMVNGHAAGTWKRSFIKNQVIIAPAFFTEPSKAQKHQVKKAAAAYGRYLNKEVKLTGMD
ncbi:MAG TPA: winged helix DNA-binding domain-containing protein [Bacteroidia bacterium]|nr:winged helix DNA-binding domain-containing protein [Bacteroidia bacterium]